MKVNDHFVLRSIYGQHLLFPVSKNAVGNELISLNEVGADIWKCASKGLPEQEIISDIDAIFRKRFCRGKGRRCFYQSTL